ncbi:MAG TPA: ATP-binding protein [Vicinamibacterales bacterium]|nr:ATP-binding protein [Vicinamibacterales bacterium]
MRILNGQPIRRQVLVATGVLLLPFAVAAMWASQRTRRERANEVRDQAESIATTAAAYLTQYLSSIDSMALLLEQHPDVMTLDRARCDRLFARIIQDQPLILNISLVDTRGSLRGSGLSVPPELKLTTRPYLNAVMTTGKPVVSELLTGQLSGKPSIVLAYPVRGPDGAVTGVLGLGINLARLQTVFGSIPLPNGSVITLTDGASRVLARSRDPERFIGTLVSTKPVQPRDVARSQTLIGLDGVERFYGNAIVERGPWLLSVGIPSDVAASSVANLKRRNLTIGGLAIFAVLTVSLWLSAILSRDLNRLRAGVQRIADGDLSPPTRNPVPNLELEQLQDGFITMAANLRETRTALDHQIEQERKMRETLQSLQRQVVRQERLAAVGVLVSGVAHELNNPLQAILGTAELLERQEDLSAQARDEIAFVKTQSGRAREIIRNLSRFSGQQSEPPSFIDLRDVITEVIQLRRRDLDNLSIALDVEISSCRAVYANFTEIEQVALNFVINAQQSIESSGRPNGHILIRLSDAGKRVLLEVCDNGPGVSAEDEPKLFQPFFTTKPVGKGTGLGLSVSYGIIDSYGGSIGYRNNEWGGATFFFELPGADMPAPAPPGPSAPAAPDTNDRQALLQRRVSPRV